MEKLTDYTSLEDDTKPSLFQAMNTAKEITDYKPGDKDYHEATVTVAKELADEVTERNQDATYEEVMDIDWQIWDQFDSLDAVAIDEHEAEKARKNKSWMSNDAQYAIRDIVREKGAGYQSDREEARLDPETASYDDLVRFGEQAYDKISEIWDEDKATDALEWTSGADYMQIIYNSDEFDDTPMEKALKNKRAAL